MWLLKENYHKWNNFCQSFRQKNTSFGSKHEQERYIAPEGWWRQQHQSKMIQLDSVKSYDLRDCFVYLNMFEPWNVDSSNWSKAFNGEWPGFAEVMNISEIMIELYQTWSPYSITSGLFTFPQKSLCEKLKHFCLPIVFSDHPDRLNVRRHVQVFILESDSWFQLPSLQLLRAPLRSRDRLLSKLSRSLRDSRPILARVFYVILLSGRPFICILSIFSGPGPSFRQCYRFLLFRLSLFVWTLRWFIGFNWKFSGLGNVYN
jgi:hypothetical protein